MALQGFDQKNHFSELSVGIEAPDGTGWMTPAERRAECLTNLGLGGGTLDLSIDDLTVDNTFTLTGTVDADYTITEGTAPWDFAGTSASTDGGTSVVGLQHAMTMTGAGGVGGRALFSGTANVGLGGWSNALKAIWTYGASGSTSGLGSALVAEMVMSAGTTSGTYAPLEVELGMPSGASTGTATSLMYLSVYGADASTFDTSGFLFDVAGVTIGAGNLVRASVVTDVDSTHAIRIRVDGTTLYIPAHTSPSFA